MADINPKGVVAYRVMEVLARRCGTCYHFLADQCRCALVAGEIMPDMVCDIFAGRRASVYRPTVTIPTDSILSHPLDVPTALDGSGDSLHYAIAKATEERRYTFGPLYVADTLDAHGEFVTAEVLQNAAWDYVRRAVASGSNTIYRQHTGKPAGEWVEITSWPEEYTVKMDVPGTGKVERTFPPGTVFQGVVWNEETWPDVKAGKILGLSMGGRAQRVEIVENPASAAASTS